MNSFWFWFVVGLAPYYVNVQRENEVITVKVQAIGWSLVVRIQCNKVKQCIVRIPLIEHLKK
jgi:hypothetical protein